MQMYPFIVNVKINYFNYNSAKWLVHVSGTTRIVQPTDVAMLCKVRLEDIIAVQWPEGVCFQ